MIVKDEAEALPRCLRSVQGIVDEIVVLDTGSTDATPQIAAEFGAKVHSHPWNNSFSEARNHALQFVQSDWVLVLDADEELERGDAPLLRKALRGDDYHAVHLSVLNYMPQGRVQLYSPRVFRRGKGRYEGVVHNQLIYEGAALVTQVRVYHYGYALAPEKLTAKYERTTRLLRVQLEKNPQDVFAWYNLIRMYRIRRHFELAACTGREVLEDLSFEGKEHLFLMICYDVACSSLELGDLRSAEAFCKKALKVEPAYIDALFTMGVVQSKMGQWAKAARAYIHFLEALASLRRSPTFHRLCLDTMDYEFLAHALLGECLLHIEAFPQAREHFERALALYEANRHIWPDEVCPHPDILMQMGNAAVGLGQFDLALSFFQQRLHLGEPTPQLLNNMAGCYAKLGDLDKAIDAYEHALRLNPHYEEARRNLALLQRLRGKRAAIPLSLSKV
jgi:tetratricopeptide (TPR) repeat protein